MIIVSDIKTFVKNSDEFVIKNPRKACLYSIVLKIMGTAFLIFMSSSLYFLIPSFYLFTASIFVDHKILKNFEALIFNFIEKFLNHNPDRAGFYLGRIFSMVMHANPEARFRGMYRGFFFQRSLYNN